MNLQQAEFDLTSDETPRDRFGRAHPLPPPEKGGRRPGSASKLTREIKHLAEKRGIGFIVQMFDRAERLADDGDIRCAAMLLARVWPKPRSAPVQIDLSSNVDARQLLVAMANGQLTPSDAASLLNSLSRNGHSPAAALEAVQSRVDIRDRIAERLQKMLAARAERTEEQDAEAALAELMAEPSDEAADQKALEEFLAEDD